jgi:hypothetical protein
LAALHLAAGTMSRWQHYKKHTPKVLQRNPHQPNDNKLALHHL